MDNWFNPCREMIGSVPLPVSVFVMVLLFPGTGVTNEGTDEVCVYEGISEGCHEFIGCHTDNLI